MNWNWQHINWPNFEYNQELITNYENKFLYKSGLLEGSFININNKEIINLTIDLISDEAIKTSEIEGEFLNRDSVQASIRRNFGLEVDRRKIGMVEQGTCDMMLDIYHNHNAPLTHEMLYKWHHMLTSGRRDISDIGTYRTHEEPMEIISGPIGNPKIHYIAPPSNIVYNEMDKFMHWFNSSRHMPAILRASIAHLYFESIHPFEDGNGRIGRAIVLKSISESINKPILLGLSYAISGNKKRYYHELEAASQNLNINRWLEYFAEVILEAQEISINKVLNLINKTKFFDKFDSILNERQKKAMYKMLDGFENGITAEKYINITKASRATATRDLQDLVDRQILHKTGERKHTKYFISDV